MSTVKAPTINHRISNSVDIPESVRTGEPVTGLCGLSFVIREQEPGGVVKRTAGKAYRCFKCEYRFDVLQAGLPVPTDGEPEAPVWKNWKAHDFERRLIEAAYGEYFAADNLPPGTLGEWSWVRRGRGKPQITLKVSRHPDVGREAQLAHMFLHLEEGTQCSRADPHSWGAYEWEIETRALERMGLESRRMVPCELEAQRATSHVAKSELRRRSTTPARVSTTEGRR